MSNETQGLQMKYFVLKPKGTDEYAEASRRAMSAYADHIEEFDPEFARELSQWAVTETLRTERARFEQARIERGAAILNGSKDE